MRKGNNKLTLSMIVKNEADRYLRRALEVHREFIDEAVIIDDGSTDATGDICREALAGIPLRLVQNSISMFSNEVVLRKQQWEETLCTNPEWILNLDADEIFEVSFARQVDDILIQNDYDAVYFRLYDMWSETHYREDSFWHAHAFYRPFLVRYRPDVVYTWRKSPQHCGRLPLTIQEFSYMCHPARVRHYGWALPEDRLVKYQRYTALDKDARYGWKEQYESILDENPNLISWET